MRPLVLAFAVVAIVAGAVAFSRPDPNDPLRLKSEKRNPWTHLQLNNDAQSFQFAILGDRTGSHRAKVFSRSIDRLNLLQPDFVLTVGDLIEGGKQPVKRLNAEWEELDGYVKRLKMPFFYLPGNHDAGNAQSDSVWTERYGRRYYHFVYRSVLFLCLNSEDPPDAGGGNMSKEQVAYAQKAIADNADVRWTIVLIHRPIWTFTNLEKRGWGPVEKALASRPYTVFCGHIHRYQRFVRQGRNYYQLATTGGGSKMRGVEFGEFDHVAWVTMKKNGPVIANILLDSVLPDDLKVPQSTEKASGKRSKLTTYPVRGQVYLDGSPLVGARVVLHPIDEKIKGKVAPEGFTEADGSFRATTYTNFDGIPAGTYAVTVVQRPLLSGETRKYGPNQLPGKYASASTSGLQVEIKDADSRPLIELKR